MQKYFMNPMTGKTMKNTHLSHIASYGLTREEEHFIFTKVEKLKAEKKEFFDYIICNDSFLNMIAVSGFIIIINPEAMSDEEIKSFNECFEEAENTIIVSTRDFKRRKNFPIYFNIAIDISNPLCEETYYNLMKFGVEYMEYKFYYDSSKKSFLS